MRRGFSFTGTAPWVLEGVKEDLKKNTKATGTVKLFGPTNCGALTIEAPSKEELDRAERYITSHGLYKHHFTASGG